jgi:serine/threonine protein phosphatase PrpC
MVAEEETAAAPAISSAVAGVSLGHESSEHESSLVGGRQPRPPRVPRSPGVSATRAPDLLPDVAPADESSGRLPLELADADTMTYEVVPSRTGAVHTVPLPGGRGAEAETSPADGLPWPLLPPIIVGGRYRVETVLSSGPAEPSAENAYLVSDLQGYEQCWSCHTRHGPEASANRRCPDCGADMLDHDCILRERLIPAVELESGTSSLVAEVEAAASTSGERFFTQGQRAYRVSTRGDQLTRFPHGARILSGVTTDRGRGRPDEPNQDSTGLLDLSITQDIQSEPFVLGIVADGLGGHDSGHEASQLTVRAITENILRALAVPRLTSGESATPTALDDEVIEQALRTAVQSANATLWQRNQAQGSDGGSTVVVALIARETAFIANVGDSRAYVLELDGLRRITTDHSLVEQLVVSGVLTNEERYDHPQRNQILRSLGEEETEVDLFKLRLRPGMRLLLCSDGLWEMVRDDECARILMDAATPQTACDALVRAANEHGGEDNISALVLEAQA